MKDFDRIREIKSFSEETASQAEKAAWHVYMASPEYLSACGIPKNLENLENLFKEFQEIGLKIRDELANIVAKL